jgi:hypothetical protein
MTGTDWSADLDEFVEGGPLPPDDEPLPPIEGQEHADAWLRRLARLRSDVDEINRTAHAEIDKIDAWRTDRVSGIERDLVRIQQHVESWARSMLKGAKRKSLSLPWGTPSRRAGSTTVVATDARAFETWALSEGREALLLAAKVREPDKRAVAAAFKPGPVIEQDESVKRHAAVDDDGAVVPGVVLVVPVRDTFTIKEPTT